MATHLKGARGTSVERHCSTMIRCAMAFFCPITILTLISLNEYRRHFSRLQQQQQKKQMRPIFRLWQNSSLTLDLASPLQTLFSIGL